MQKPKLAILQFSSGSLLAFLAVSLNIFVQYLSGYLSFEVTHQQNFIPVLSSIPLQLAVAFFEEFIFRVLLLGFLLKVSGKHYVAIIVGSLLFAGAHAANSHFTTIAFVSHFLGGVVYSYAYLKTKAIWLPFGLHFGWNFTQAILGMPVSGSASYGFLSITFSSDAFYNGGPYGFEGGMLSIISRIALLLVLAYTLRKYFYSCQTLNS